MDLDRTAFLRDATAARRAADDSSWADAVGSAERALAMPGGDDPALRERRSELREALITGLLGLDRIDEAVGAAQALAGGEPLRERACWLLVVALFRAGRIDDALAAYAAHAGALDRFGLEPGPALRDLHGAVARGDRELRTWPRQAAAPTPARPRPSATPADRAPFVGREPEQAAIQDAIATADGSVRWIVLIGPAGIGKTRLAEETMARTAAAGARTVRTGCPEDEGTPPWWPLRLLVRGLGGEPDTVLAAPEGVASDVARFAVYDRLDGLVRAAARTPTTLLVDDVQWADATSMRWLTHLASSVYTGDLTILLTVRSGVPTPELDRLLAAVARHEGARTLELEPLAVAQVQELVKVVSGEDLDRREALAVAEQTGGNPFFVGELARLPRAERASGGVPLAVSAVLKRRLGGVAPEVVDVLRAAAVVGDPIDLYLVAAVARLDPDDVADRVDEALAAALLEEHGDQLRFAHGLLRAEVLAGLPVRARQRLHLRTAEAVRVHGGPDLLARYAHHLVAAGSAAPAQTVLDACTTAATDADARWHSDAAADWWGAAIAAYERTAGADRDDARYDELLVLRVAALARAGKRQQVMDTVEQALGDALRDGRTRIAGRLARTILRTAGVWPWAISDDPGPLLQRLRAVEPLVAEDPAAHARVLVALAVGLYYAPDQRLRDDLSAQALVVAERLGDPDVLADALLGRALAFSGLAERSAEVVTLLDRLHTLDHDVREIDDVLRHTMLTMTLTTLGEVDAAEEHLRLGVEGKAGLRMPVCRVQLRWAEATLANWRGRLDEAETIYAHAIDLHRQTELYVFGVHLVAMIALRFEQGRLDEVDVLADENERFMPLTVGALAIASGRVAEGVATVRAALGVPPLALWTTHAELALVANVVVDAGAVELAPPLLERLTPYAPYVANLGQAGIVGTVALAMARLHRLMGDDDAARRRLAEATALAERGGGVCAMLRCRLLAAELEHAPPAVFATIAADAARIGMREVARQAAARS